MSDASVNALSTIAASPLTSGNNSARDEKSWFEALSEAWGDTLDQQADKLIALSEQIGPDGNDKPSILAELSAESQRMGFMSNAQSTSVNSVGEALKTMARKN